MHLHKLRTKLKISSMNTTYSGVLRYDMKSTIEFGRNRI